MFEKSIKLLEDKLGGPAMLSASEANDYNSAIATLKTWDPLYKIAPDKKEEITSAVALLAQLLEARRGGNMMFDWVENHLETIKECIAQSSPQA
jgi:hypothetical protein